MKVTDRVKRYLALARTRARGFGDRLIIEEMDRMRAAMNPSELRYIEHNEATCPGVLLNDLLAQSRRV